MPSARLAPAALALAAFAPAAADEILLRRYVPVTVYRGVSDDLPHGDTYTYMDVQDTHIARATPDLNFGGAATLTIRDPADAILIAFRQLNRAVPVGSTVQAVELQLHPAGEIDEDAAVALYRVTLPWRDGHSDGARQSFAATYNDRFAGEGVHRRPWSEPGGAADRAAEPSVAGRLGEFWDPQRRAFVFRGPGLVADVRAWLGRHFQNHGWMLTVQPGTRLAGPLALVSSDVVQVGDPAGFTRPALRIVYEPKPLAQLARPALPDLDVTYIERSPRFTRYHDNGVTSYERKMFRTDNVGIMKRPDYADEPKWPAAGQAVTFTAHVKNAGPRPVAGPVSYRWLLNDRVVGEGRFEGGLAPWTEWTAEHVWTWAVDHGDHRNLLLEFEVDPEDRVAEITENNNRLGKYVGAKTLKYWVERGAYAYVQDFPCAYGSYSFEDYLQWHFAIWNDTYFDQSRFAGVAPDGCLERTTLDDFGIVENGLLGGGIHRPHDRWDPHFDGEWGTEWDVGTRTTPEAVERGIQERVRAGRDRAAAEAEYRRWAREADENDLRFLRTRRIVLEGSLLHEASHQTIGAYDIYWSNIEASTPTEPIGKCRLKDETGFYIPRGSWYAWAGLMGGSDTRPTPDCWEGTGLYSVNTVGGVNTNLACRNGFYGEWQYDLPRECFVHLTSPDGVPLAGARVSIWQAHSNTIDEAGLVARDLVADERGRLRLPDQDTLEEADYTTLTGHTLRRRNPFGRLDVVGENITLLLRVDACGQRDYRFVRVIDFNSLYWLGQREAATLPLPCRICPSDRLDLAANVARGAAVRATTGAETAARLVDDDVTTAWVGGATRPGDYVELELPQLRRVGLVQIVQDEAHGAFYPRFVIRVGDGGGGAGLETFAVQAPESFALAMSNEKDARGSRPSERWVSYAGRPRPARVIRIEALEGGAAHVSEIRVLAEK